MNAKQYRECINKLGLSQVKAAELLGVNDRTSRRWALAEQQVSPPAARFLQYLVATKANMQKVMRILGEGK